MTSPQTLASSGRKSLGTLPSNISDQEEANSQSPRKSVIPPSTLDKFHTDPPAPPPLSSESSAASENEPPPAPTNRFGFTADVSPQPKAAAPAAAASMRKPSKNIPVKSSGYGRPSTASSVPSSSDSSSTASNARATADAIRASRKSSSGVMACSPAKNRRSSDNRSSYGRSVQMPKTPKRTTDLMSMVTSFGKSTKKKILGPALSSPPGVASESSSSGDCEILTAYALHFTSAGFSEPEVKSLVNTRLPGQSWELNKKVSASKGIIADLKTAVKGLHESGIKLRDKAHRVETTVKEELHSAKANISSLKTKNTKLSEELKAIAIVNVATNDQKKEAARELRSACDKVSGLEAELAPLKDALATAERERTKLECELAGLQARSEEATVIADSWREELKKIEEGKAEELRAEKERLREEFEADISTLTVERDEMKSKMDAREAELSRLCEGDATGNGNTVAGVKLELDRLRAKTLAADAEISRMTAELAAAIHDADTARATAADKDKNFNTLMASINQIQQSSQSREDEQKEMKRAVQARLEEVQAELATCKEAVATLTAEKSALESAVSEARTALDSARIEMDELKAEVNEFRTGSSGMEAELRVEKELRSRAEDSAREEKSERVATSAQMMAMTSEHSAAEARLREELERVRAESESTIVDLRAKLEERSNKVEEMQGEVKGLVMERDALKEVMKEKKFAADASSAEEVARLKGALAVLEEKLANAELKSAAMGNKSAGDVKELEDLVVKLKADKRKMFNIIQELRGNVRVFARVRPFLPNDNLAEDQQIPFVKALDENRIEAVNEKGNIKFSFDRVFGPSTGQEKVFEEVSEFVQSALDGYHVCLFSYGQTGSGKTHTMQGSGQGAMKGIIPRTMEQVASYKKQLESDGWTFNIEISYLEIHNEVIRDLLREESNVEQKHEIRVDGNRKYVENLTMEKVDINNESQVEEILRRAARTRSVASTNMNEESSRSHSVFTLHLVMKNVQQKIALRSQLNLVDLAGSERVGRSGATGKALREAQNINKSLSSLAGVFSALSAKQSHIPFRDSKLTYLLQPCLSGDGKTLMIVNLSPTEESTQESTCSLRFASQVNKVELGKSKKVVEDLDEDGNVKEHTAGKKGNTSPKRSKSARPRATRTPGRG